MPDSLCSAFQFTYCYRLCLYIMQVLEAGKWARTAVLSKDELTAVKGLGLLTIKPLIYAANVNEEDLPDAGATNKHVQVRALWDAWNLCILHEGHRGINCCASK